MPIIVGLLGLLGTAGGAITGAIITQRRSDRRETLAWERERERERERWAREDAARTFDLRLERYEALLQAIDNVIRDYVKVLNDRLNPSLDGGSVDGYEFSREKEAAFDAALERATIFGSAAVASLASGLERSVQDIRVNLSFEAVKQIEVRRSWLVNAIRIELGIPEGPIKRAAEVAELLGDISVERVRPQDT